MADDEIAGRTSLEGDQPTGRSLLPDDGMARRPLPGLATDDEAEPQRLEHLPEDGLTDLDMLSERPPVAAQPLPAPSTGNPFDRFDRPSVFRPRLDGVGNPFDAFDDPKDRAIQRGLDGLPEFSILKQAYRSRQLDQDLQEAIGRDEQAAQARRAAAHLDPDGQKAWVDWEIGDSRAEIDRWQAALRPHETVDRPGDYEHAPPSADIPRMQEALARAEQRHELARQMREDQRLGIVRTHSVPMQAQMAQAVEDQRQRVEVLRESLDALTARPVPDAGEVAQAKASLRDERRKLAVLEKQRDAGRQRPAVGDAAATGEMVRQIGAGVAHGTEAIGGALVRYGEDAGGGLGAAMELLGLATRDFGREAGRDTPAEAQGELLKLDPGKAGFFRDLRLYMAAKVGQAAGSSLMVIGAAVGGGPLAGGGVGVAMGHGQMQNALEEAFAEQGLDLSPETARHYTYLYGTVMGALESVTELWALGGLSKQVAAKSLARSLAVGVAKGAAIEGVTEGLQELLETHGVSQATGQPIDWTETRRRVIEGVAAGAVGGGALGALTAKRGPAASPGPEAQASTEPVDQLAKPTAAEAAPAVDLQGGEGNEVAPSPGESGQAAEPTDARTTFETSIRAAAEAMPEAARQGFVDTAMRQFDDEAVGPTFELQPGESLSSEDVESVVDMWRYVQEERGQREPVSLTEWLRSVGGLREDAGELKNMLGAYNKRPGLVSKKGLHLDEATLRAWEMGFLDGDERPEINDLLNALDDDLRGQKRVSGPDRARMDEIAAVRQMEQDLADLGVYNARSEDEIRATLRRRPGSTDGAGGEATAGADAAGSGPQGARGGETPARQAQAHAEGLTAYLAGGGSLARRAMPALAEHLGVTADALPAVLDAAVTAGALRKTAGGQYRRATQAAKSRPEDLASAIETAVAEMAPLMPAGTTVKVSGDVAADAGAQGRAAEAAYVPATGDILLSAAAIDPQASLGHEAVHALRAKGMLTDAEIALLAERAAKIPDLFDRAAYAQAYAGREDIDGLLQEEAAAHLVEARIAGTTFGAEIDTILDRIILFLEKLRNALAGKGFRTADDVVAAIVSGEVGGRAGRARSAAGIRFQLGTPADRVDSLGYYSKALEAAKGLKQAKGTPQQMLAQLKAAGVKDAEIRATGLDYMLEADDIVEEENGDRLAPRRSISRDEIVSHLTRARISLTEKVYERGDNAGAVEKELQAWREQTIEVQSSYDADSRKNLDFSDKEEAEVLKFLAAEGIELDEDEFVADDGQPLFALSPRRLHLRRRPAPTDLASMNVVVRDLASALDIVTRRGMKTTRSKRAARQVRREQEGAELRAFHDPQTGVLRMRRFNDVTVFAEAAGRSLGHRYATPLRTAATQTGVAVPTDMGDWFQRYLMNPAAALDDPFTDVFESVVDAAEPRMLARIESAQAAISAYTRAQPAAIMRSIIVPSTKAGIWERLDRDAERFGWPTAVGMRLSDLYANVWSSEHPFYLATLDLLRRHHDLTGRKIDLSALANPAKLWLKTGHARRVATRDLDLGIRPAGSNNHSGPSLRNVLITALGPSRRQAVDTGPGSRYRDFGAYLLARMGIERWNNYQAAVAADTAGQLVEPYAVPQAVMIAAVQDLETQYPTFAAAAEMLYQFQRNLLTLQFTNGLITEDQHSALMAEENYVPSQRSFDDDSQLSGGSGKKADAARADVIKRFRGSQRDVVDPIASIALKMFKTRADIAVNDTLKQLLYLAETVGPGGGHIAERLDASQSKAFAVDIEDALRQAAREANLSANDRAALVDLASEMLGSNVTTTMFTQGLLTSTKGEPIVWVKEHGLPVPVRLGKLGEGGHASAQLGQTIYDMLNTFGEAHTGWVTELMAKPAQFLRKGIVSYPGFMAVNMVRDSLSAFGYDPRALPVWTQIKGVIDVVRGADYVQGYRSAGGQIGGETTQLYDEFIADHDVRTLVRQGYRFATFDSLGNAVSFLQDSFSLERWPDKLFGASIGAISGFSFGGPVGLAVGAAIGGSIGGNTLSAIGELSETATRSRLWLHAYDRAIASGSSEAQAAAEALTWAHDYSDYGRHGLATEALRRTIPFLNANLQANDSFVRRLLAKGDYGFEATRYVPGYVALWPLYRAGVLELPRTLSRRQREEIAMSAWTWFNTIAVIGSISMVYALVYRDDERVDLLPQHLRASHWNIPLDDLAAVGSIELAAENRGKLFVRMAKPFERAIIANTIERLVMEKARGNPRWLEHWLSDMVQVTLPPVVPAALELGGQLMSNRDWFSGREIVPNQAAGRMRPEQFDDYTSDFGRWLGGKLDLSPHHVDFLITKLGSSWGRDALKANIPGTPWYDPKAPREGLDEKFIASRFLYKVGRGTEAEKGFREAMGGQAPLPTVMERITVPYDRLDAQANSYRYLKDTLRQDVAALAKLEGMTQGERGYALLEGHWQGRNARYQQLHPMKRAETVAMLASQLQKEMLGDRTTAGRKGPLQSVLDLSPNDKAAARDVLTQYKAMEITNAMILVDQPGWKGHRMQPAARVLQELAIAVPAVHAEFTRRLEKAHVLPFEGVKATWPRVKATLEGSALLRRVKDKDTIGLGAELAGEYAEARSHR